MLYFSRCLSSPQGAGSTSVIRRTLDEILERFKMANIQIIATTSPKEEDKKIIDQGITEYNLQKIGEQKYIPIASFAKDENQTIGGITGNLFWNYLYIDLMWIDENYRGKGIGRKLIEAVEKLAIENGIFRSHLCTASFQSLGFYEKCGYSVFGKLDDMPEGETEYHLYKKLLP